MVDALVGGQFVPNDVVLDTASERCFIITGPNMGGKSCYIRQAALITIMAQIGSYVPAESADIGVVDAIFVRMGAADSIMRGMSTFRVELEETSAILRCATRRSLVVLDELGRGTSTHDGVAIAYAVAHHLIADVGCLTLFVTHYPLLAELERRFPGIAATYHMAFMSDRPPLGRDGPGHADADGDTPEAITFLYQLTRGVAHRSYGLNVARLAGIPPAILRASEAKAHELELAVATRAGATRQAAVVRDLIAALAQAVSCVPNARAARISAILANESEAL